MYRILNLDEIIQTIVHVGPCDLYLGYLTFCKPPTPSSNLKYVEIKNG